MNIEIKDKLYKDIQRVIADNEINFDYVRFPDRMNSVSKQVDLRNSYQEDKAQAIQRFIQYAKDKHLNIREETIEKMIKFANS